MTTVSGSPSNGTNGTSAPQAPAPGVSTPTPTPKNGEGAVAQPPKQGETTPAKPSWQAIKTKLKFGDGQEEEVEVPDEETLQRRLIAAKGFDRANKDKLAAQRELERVSRLAQDNPEEFLRAFKHDPKKLVEKWAKEELARLEMTEEQRAAVDAQKARQAAEAKAAALEKQVQQFLQKQQLDAQWAKEAPEWEASLKKRNRLGDESYIDVASQVRKYLEDNNINATIEQVCALADEEWDRQIGVGIERTPTGRLAENLAKRATEADVPSILKALGPKLTPKALWESLPDDAARKAVGDLLLAWHKGRKASPTTNSTPPPRQQEVKTYRTESEWKASRK